MMGSWPVSWARPRAATVARSEMRIALPPRVTARRRAPAPSPPPVVREPPIPPVAAPTPAMKPVVRVVALGPIRRVQPRAEVTPRASASGQAVLLGIVQGGGTSLTMVPADLTKGPRTDVVNFRIVSMDAGVY